MVLPPVEESVGDLEWRRTKVAQGKEGNENKRKQMNRVLLSLSPSSKIIRAPACLALLFFSSSSCRKYQNLQEMYVRILHHTHGTTPKLSVRVLFPPTHLPSTGRMWQWKSTPSKSGPNQYYYSPIHKPLRLGPLLATICLKPYYYTFTALTFQTSAPKPHT